VPRVLPKFSMGRMEEEPGADADRELGADAEEEEEPGADAEEEEEQARISPCARREAVINQRVCSRNDPACQKMFYCTHLNYMGPL
jgi:hypothetical protein